MEPEGLQLTVQLDGPDIDDEERERALRQLRDELRAVSLDADLIPVGSAPPGSKGVIAEAATYAIVIEVPLAFGAHVVTGIIYHMAESTSNSRDRMENWKYRRSRPKQHEMPSPLGS
jgi:hypothetical protein